jgi:hypothetical protein
MISFSRDRGPAGRDRKCIAQGLIRDHHQALQLDKLCLNRAEASHKSSITFLESSFYDPCSSGSRRPLSYRFRSDN